MWCQRDPRWASYLLGYGPDTIGADGCLMCCDADLMTWTGHQMAPDQLNQEYLAKGIYTGGELLSDTALVDAYPDLWALDSIYHCEASACDQNQLNNDDPNLYVKVMLMGPNGLTHFVPLTDWRNWICADPWTGTSLSIGQVGANFGWGSNPVTLVGKATKVRYIGGGAAAPAPPAVAAPNASTFQGSITAGGAHVRVLPGLDQALVEQPGANPDVIDGGTALAFDGWCHHQPSGRGADAAVPLDDAFTPPKPDDRWFRVQGTGHWISSPGVDYANGADPPIALLVADPAPAPAPPPVPQPVTGPVNKTVPDVLKGVAVWETSPSYGVAADYASLAKTGVSAVLIRAANGDGTGASDATVFEPNWTTRAPGALLAGVTPVAWTAWYGSGSGAWGGVTGDVATYLLGCAQHTADLDAKMAPATPAWVIDAENPNMPGLGAALAKLAQLTDKPIIINPPGDPQTFGINWDWASINEAVAAAAPQMYTADWASAMSFDAAVAQMIATGLTVPMLPVLDETDPARIALLLARAKALGMPGISFWYFQGGNPAVFQDYVGTWSATVPAPALKPPPATAPVLQPVQPGQPTLPSPTGPAKPSSPPSVAKPSHRWWLQAILGWLKEMLEPGR